MQADVRQRVNLALLRDQLYVELHCLLTFICGVFTAVPYNYSISAGLALPFGFESDIPSNLEILNMNLLTNGELPV